MNKMNLKNNKKKKKKYKLIFLLLTIYIIFSYTFYYSFKNIKDDINKDFIKFLINNGNSSLINEYKVPTVINKSINYLLKIDLTNPVSIFNKSIIDNNYREEDNLEELKAISSYITDPYSKTIDNPVIYIYNSHQLENYNSENLSIYGITPNVLMASYLLKEKLNNIGIPTIVEDTNITEFLSLNNWDYSSSYRASRIFLLDKQNTYPTLKYFIDIHRDSITKDISTVSINGKRYAKILFVVGLEHNNWSQNYNIVNNINNLFNTYYPNISRGILKKEGPGVNGIYNQDINTNVMLIEVGGVDNNIEEVMNTINAITDILSKYIGEYEKS